MILPSMVITTVIALVLILFYEIQVSVHRRRAVMRTSRTKMAELIRISHSSSTAMLSLAAIVFSVWSAFVLLATPTLQGIYGDDIAFILALSLTAIACYAISSFLHHATSYFEFETKNEREEIKLRMRLYHSASMFFTVGTIFLLLSFLFSFVIIVIIMQVSTASTLLILALAAGPLMVLMGMAVVMLRPILKYLPTEDFETE